MTPEESATPINGTKVVFPADCGHTPRSAWLKDFNLAFIEGDIERTLGFVSEDIVWELVGEGTIAGRDGMRAWLESMAGKRALRAEFEHFITQGKVAAVNGSYEMESGSRFRFSDIYEFESDRDDSPILHYTSYVVRV